MTDKEIDTHVGQKIRAYRKFADMSQSDLAEHLDVRFQQLQKYENASNRISASKLWRVAQALNRPVSAFFEGIE